MNRAYLLIFTILFIGMISATTTTLSSQTSFNVNKSSSGSFIVSYSIIENVGNPGSNGVSITGNPSVLIYSGSSLSYLANQTTNGTFTMNYLIPSNASGTILNSIVVDGFVLNIEFNIQEPIVVESGCHLIELSHPATFIIKQGESSVSDLISVRASSECPSLEFTGVSEQTQMSKPMFIKSKGESNPGKEYTFTLGLDASGISSGTYSNTYTVEAIQGDNILKKAIKLSTIVTVGSNPVNEGTFTSLPQCTLESSMQLNNTYSLVCNYENPNIKISVPYSPFFKGVSVSESEGKFEYKMIPLKTGVTDFFAYFEYNGNSIGEPYKKEVRVSQGAVPLQGTTLDIQFYQKGVKKEINQLSQGNLTILVKDSNTQSIVSDYTIYLNGQVMNSTFQISPENYYELIVDSSGYLSKTLILNVTENPIDMFISPEKQVYYVGDTITIITDVNASLLLDNQVINSPYTLQTAGNIIIKAVKEGYTDTEKNITVESRITYSAMTPLIENWKKGKDVVIQLSKNASWDVQRDGVSIGTGIGNIVSFKLEKLGNYQILADGQIVLSKTIENNSTKILGLSLTWIALIVIILGVLGYLLSKGKSSSTEVGYG